VLDLQNSKLSFILVSSNVIDDMTSILYAKNYQILPIQGYYNEQYDNCALAFSNIDNDELRKDMIFLLNHLKQESGIIKYIGESVAKKIYFDGSERPMSISLYNTDNNNVSYLHNGLSFSFVDEVRYWKPTKREDFKIDMIVEYLNNNKWTQRKVKNPSEEWVSLWGLLVKYDKVRVKSVL
jgi:hypothetical protein